MIFTILYLGILAILVITFCVGKTEEKLYGSEAFIDRKQEND